MILQQCLCLLIADVGIENMPGCQGDGKGYQPSRQNPSIRDIRINTEKWPDALHPETVKTYEDFVKNNGRARPVRTTR